MDCSHRSVGDIQPTSGNGVTPISTTIDPFDRCNPAELSRIQYRCESLVHSCLPLSSSSTSSSSSLSSSSPVTSPLPPFLIQSTHDLVLHSLCSTLYCTPDGSYANTILDIKMALKEKEKGYQETMYWLLMIFVVVLMLGYYMVLWIVNAERGGGGGQSSLAGGDRRSRLSGDEKG